LVCNVCGIAISDCSDLHGLGANYQLDHCGVWARIQADVIALRQLLFQVVDRTGGWVYSLSYFKVERAVYLEVRPA
jgi:hypothetical protein